jgi:hypothetical protein
MPKPLPPIVKQYKHKTIYGSIPGMQRTGVYLNEGNLYSILATGTIDISPGVGGGLKIAPSSGRFIARIGKNYYFLPTYGSNAFTTRTQDSGRLYLGIKDGRVTRYGEPLWPGSYGDNSGSFRVDIIVWETDDYVQVADFFEKMKEKDPENKAVADALYDAMLLMLYMTLSDKKRYILQRQKRQKR